jgi:hypothetical protein
VPAFIFAGQSHIQQDGLGTATRVGGHEEQVNAGTRAANAHLPAAMHSYRVNLGLPWLCEGSKHIALLAVTGRLNRIQPLVPSLHMAASTLMNPGSFHTPPAGGIRL